MPNDLTAPTIHPNGTSRDALKAGYEAAYNALDAAYDVLRQTAPNARDYYPQAGDVFPQAVREHHARLRRIDDVKAELEDLMNRIDAQ